MRIHLALSIAVRDHSVIGPKLKDTKLPTNDDPQRNVRFIPGQGTSQGLTLNGPIEAPSIVLWAVVFKTIDKIKGVVRMQLMVEYGLGLTLKTKLYN